MLDHRHFRTFCSQLPNRDAWTITELIDAALADATKAVNSLRKHEGAQNIQRETVIIDRGDTHHRDSIEIVLGAVIMIVISYDVEV